jgi:hypothetical protein
MHLDVGMVRLQHKQNEVVGSEDALCLKTSEIIVEIKCPGLAMLIKAQIVIGPVLISAIAVIVLKLVVSSVVLVLGIEFFFTFIISCMKSFF